MVKHSHKCQYELCANIAVKDKYGNYKKYCCNECKKIGTNAKFAVTYANKDMNAILEKRKTTNKIKYGVANVAQADFVRDKLRITTTDTAEIRTRKTIETNLKNHGVESTNSLQSVKDKKKSNYLEKHGVDHQLKRSDIAASVSKKNSENAKERLAKSHITNLEKYGCENPSSNADVQAKRTETMIERFGVENCSQNAEIHEKKMKSSYLAHDYTLPSGKIIRVQGGEGEAIDILLKTYAENDMVFSDGNRPTVIYDLNGVNHYYFPDIYIPKENLIIEVKSKYTYEHNRTMTEAKRAGCIKSGYNYRFMIYYKNKWYVSLDEIE